ncbi:MAG: DHH family phosphoesterase [Bacilli bacterium]
MCNKIYKKIYNEIKKTNKIVIARHVGADPDALGSSIGLKEIILNTFPNKEVYVVGFPASKFRYLGNLDKFSDEMYNDSLLIVTDTPDKKRVDGVDVNLFKSVIKIDHHPFVDDFGGIEWIDNDASSASQMIMELIFNTKLKINKSAAEKLFIGLVADTNRFLFYYTTTKTFNLVSKLIKETNIDFCKLYDNLYIRPLRDIKFQSYIVNNFKITENGFAYCNVDADILEEYGVDAATAGNMVNNFNHIEEIISWAIFSYDKNSNLIRGSIRSRGPIINEMASQYGGGGHIYASGVRLKDFDEVEKFAKDLDKVCKDFIQKG